MDRLDFRSAGRPLLAALAAVSLRAADAAPEPAPAQAAKEVTTQAVASVLSASAWRQRQTDLNAAMQVHFGDYTDVCDRFLEVAAAVDERKRLEAYAEAETLMASVADTIKTDDRKVIMDERRRAAMVLVGIVLKYYPFAQVDQFSRLPELVEKMRARYVKAK